MSAIRWSRSILGVGVLALSLGTGACSGNGGSASPQKVEGSGGGGAGADASPDATTGGVMACATDAQCASQVPPTTPTSCASGTCNVLQGVCVFSAKDEDGDGHPAANCKSTNGVANLVRHL
jgi:hypothetical protein